MSMQHAQPRRIVHMANPQMPGGKKSSSVIGKTVVPKDQFAPIPKPSNMPQPIKGGNVGTPAALPLAAPKLSSLPPSVMPKVGNRFVMVSVKVAVPTNARQSRKIVERSEAQGGASRQAARAAVILFDPRHLDELRNIRSNLTRTLNEIGLKNGDGSWIVHSSRYKTLIEMGVAAEQAYKESARSFLDNYAQYCQEWAPNLGDDFDPAMYPTKEKIASTFGISLDGQPTRSKGFQFRTQMISEADESLEADMGLTLTDDERDFMAAGIRDHYQGIVDQAFDQLRASVQHIIDSDQKGRRLRKSTVDDAHDLAKKIEAMGIDHSGIAAKVAAITQDGIPQRLGSDNISKRDQFNSRMRAVLEDLGSLNGDPEVDD